MPWPTADSGGGTSNPRTLDSPRWRHLFPKTKRLEVARQSDARQAFGSMGLIHQARRQRLARARTDQRGSGDLMTPSPALELVQPRGSTAWIVAPQ